MKFNSENVRNLIKEIKKTGNILKIMGILESEKIKYFTHPSENLKIAGLEIVQSISDVINKNLWFNGKKFSQLSIQDLNENLKNVDIIYVEYN